MREFTKQQHRQNKPQSDSQSQSYDNDSSEQAVNEDQLMELEMQKIKQELKNMPYELILKQKQIKAPEKKQKSTPKIIRPKINKTKQIEKQEKVDKLEKHGAVEVSIHQRTKKYTADIFEPCRKKGIDPRFQTYAGHYNQDLAMKTYDFIPKLQQAEIGELKSKLKGQTKRHKITSDQRQVLTQEYNRLTSDYKRVQLMKLEQVTKKELKQKHGEDYHMKNNEFKQQFQKKKMQGMSQANRDRYLKEKAVKAQHNHWSERRKTLHMNPRSNRN